MARLRGRLTLKAKRKSLNRMSRIGKNCEPSTVIESVLYQSFKQDFNNLWKKNKVKIFHESERTSSLQVLCTRKFYPSKPRGELHIRLDAEGVNCFKVSPFSRLSWSVFIFSFETHTCTHTQTARVPAAAPYITALRRFLQA